MAGVPGVAQLSALNLTAGITILRPAPGAGVSPSAPARVFAVSVISSGAGGVYGSAVSGNLSAGNQIVNLSGVGAGTVIYFGHGGFPMSQGIVVSGSGGSVYALSYS